MKHRTVAEHTYVRKLRYLVQVGAIPATVGYHQVQVDHDGWCGIFQQ